MLGGSGDTISDMLGALKAFEVQVQVWTCLLFFGTPHPRGRGQGMAGGLGSRCLCTNPG